MASEIKVDTISEKTSAGGVTIDGLLIKDGGISGDVSLIGTTPTFTIGDAGAEDAALIFDGNAQDFYIALDDTADDLVIGLGSTVGTTPAVSIDENLQVIVHDNLSLLSDSSVLKFGTDGDTTLTHTDGTGLTLNSTNKICFNDASQFIQGSSNAILSLGATDEIDLTATAVDLNGTLDVSGTSTLTGAVTASAGITSTAAANTLGATSFNDANITNVGTIAVDKLISDADSSDDIAFDIATNTTVFRSGGTEWLRTTGDAKTGTGGEDAPDTDIGGICFDQNAADGKILTLKSSDIAHGITGVAETDTYFYIKKFDNNTGRTELGSFSESTQGMVIVGHQTGANTTKGTGAEAGVHISARMKDGTSYAAHDSNGNLLAVADSNAVKFIVDAEGDLHADGSATTVYDEYDDAQLVRAFDLSKGVNTIDSKFDKFIAYNHEHLAELLLVGREDDGKPNHFINVTGMQRLHNGAIWQQYEKHQQLLEAVYDLAKEAVGEDKANAILEKHEVKRLQ